MSRLIFEGDTISRFGKKIPTPFIESIAIYRNKMEVRISIYLHITEDATTNEEIYRDLSNFVLFTARSSQGITIGDSFEIVSDTIYNSEGVRYAKLSTNEVNLRFNYETSAEFAIQNQREIFYHCYISIINDEQGRQNINLKGVQQDPFVDSIGAASYRDRKNYSSALIYEKFINSDGTLSTDPNVAYVDATGNPAEMVPLYSIQKNYYKTTDSFREQLKKQIDDLVSSYGMTTDQQLQSLLDSISFVAQTKKRDVDFITELNRIRNSFPSRTSTSNIGVLYNRLKDILFSANDTLVLGTQLQKRIIENTKIINYLDIFENTELQISLPWERRNVSDYSPRLDESGRFLYDYFLMERNELDTRKVSSRTNKEYQVGDIESPDRDVVVNGGYFFFDYEKVLHKKSNISQIYEIQRLLNIFGNNVLDTFFKINKTELLRFTTKSSSKVKLKQIDSEFKDNRTKNVSYSNHDGGSAVLPGASLDLKRILQSYVVLRKFAPMIGLNDYRLLALEFQDIQFSTNATDPGQSYRFNIYLKDFTIDFYSIIKSQFKLSVLRLKQYLSFADEFCSYNNIDGKFNDFFVRSVKQFFDSDVEYPWEIAAKSYSVHLYLLLDSFGDDLELMNRFARHFSLTYLNPENTTIEILREKAEEILNFYEDHYGDNGSITRILLPVTTGGTPQRSMRENIDLIFTNTYDKFPQIVDYTPDEPEPAAITKWSGTVDDFNKQIGTTFIRQRMLALMAARMVKWEGDIGLFYNVTDSTMATALDIDGEIGQSTGRQRGSANRGSRGTFDYAPWLATKSNSNRAALINRKERKRARKIYYFIQSMLEAIERDYNEVFIYGDRKDLINVIIDDLCSSISLSRERIRGWNRADRSFVRANRSIFGNIGLYAIKALKTSAFDPTSQTQIGIRLTDVEARPGMPGAGVTGDAQAGYVRDGVLYTELE